MKPTLDEMRQLKEPLGRGFDRDGLDKIRVISGSTAVIDGGAICAGSMMLKAELLARGGYWRWVKVEDGVTDLDRTRFPDWPGIESGDLVTHGHLDALIVAGLL